MGRLTLILTVLLLTGCSVHPITEKRTRRNLDKIDFITNDILKLDGTKFLVDSLDNKVLKKNLKKMNAKRIEVFKKEHHELGQDSLIILSRHNFMLTFGEIIIDFKKNKRELTGIGGLKRVGNRTYFRERTHVIS